MIQPQLRLLVIRTTDLDRLIRFYTCFGITFTQHRHGSGPFHAAVDLEGVVFEIYPTKNPENVDRTTRLGFSVPDVQTAIISLRELGATIVEEPMESEWGLRAVVRDPDGRSVELYAEESAN